MHSSQNGHQHRWVENCCLHHDNWQVAELTALVLVIRSRLPARYYTKPGLFPYILTDMTLLVPPGE